MAKAKKRRQRKDDPLARFIRPTERREAHNDFTSAGAAVRLIPVIDQLRKRQILTDEEHSALNYYRDQASLAEHSPVRSCCDFSPRGGHGPGVSIISARFETTRIERGMGPLRYLCRAVAVDDVKLEQWCAERGERFNIAALELKYAAGGIVR